MMAIAEWALEDGRRAFSFYVTAHRGKRDPQIVEAAVDLADAVTVAGPEGPEVIRRLRESGFQAPVLFDGMGYAGKDLPVSDDWVGVQRAVGAACPLLPGALLAWDRNDDSEFIVTMQEQGRIAAGLEATMLFAIDVRWVARRTDLVVETLRSADQPAALVLIHRGDPLSERGAVQGPAACRTARQRCVLASKRPWSNRRLSVWRPACVRRAHDLDPPLRTARRGSVAAPGTIGAALHPSAARLVPSQRCGRMDSRWTGHHLPPPLLQRTVTCSVPRPRSRCRLAQHERARRPGGLRHQRGCRRSGNRVPQRMPIRDRMVRTGRLQGS